MLKFLIKFLILTLLLASVIFAAGTYVAYRHLDEFVAKVTSPKKAAAKEEPDSDEVILEQELNKESASGSAASPIKRLELLDAFDQILQTENFVSQKPLCDIICEKSRTPLQEKEDRALIMLKETFAKDPKKAFNDPGFRLNLLKIKLVTDLFPKAIRNLLFEVESTKSMTETEKYIFVAKAELAIFQFIANIKIHEKENQTQNLALTELGKLQKQCSPKTKDFVSNSCKNLNFSY